jgi:hypothetical protein
MESFDKQAMTVLMGIVKAGRKAKNATGMSLKNKDCILRVKIPMEAFSLAFSIDRDQIAQIAQFLLRIPALYVEETNFDVPFPVSDEAERYPWYAGDAVDKDTGILAQFWTRDELWAA